MNSRIAFSLVASLIFISMGTTSVNAQILPNPGSLLDLINQIQEKQELDDDSDDGEQICEETSVDDGYGTLDAIVDGCYTAYNIWRALRNVDDNEQGGSADL